MHLKSLELSGFKSFGKKDSLDFDAPLSAIVGPNGSGKSNIAEAFRFVLGEQSIKSLRGKKGEDLIWGGGKNTARSNRASVKVTFDNSTKLFDVDFDEVVLERVVHRDGINQYFINGSQVRLRDIIELLAVANIGSSGQHIISQGEADHILNANPKERREMIEGALGLKIYHYKLAESEKKLIKTRENIVQVGILRKEIAPHMRFLKKQMERVEKTRLLREDLKKLYREYLKRESLYLTFWQEHVTKESLRPKEELVRLNQELKEVKEVLEKESQGDAKSKEIIDLEEKLRFLREGKDALTRDLGRLEGEIKAEERNCERKKQGSEDKNATVHLSALTAVTEEVGNYAKDAKTEESVEKLRSIVLRIHARLLAFIQDSTATPASLGTEEVSFLDEHTLADLKRSYAEKDIEYKKLGEKEEVLHETYTNLQRDVETVRDKSREAEREMFSIMGRQNELRTALQEFSNREKELEGEKELFERELEEGAVLIGREALSFSDFLLVGSSGAELSLEDVAGEDRREQRARQREIEKVKIRLEELGGGGVGEITKEYKEIQERDQFLEHEIIDLEQSVVSLENIMSELKEKLATHFKEGMLKINKEFQNFFVLMFGGGTAHLSLIRRVMRKNVAEELLLEGIGEGDEEELESEEGIDISVSLPHKRIKGLTMLSGGERALTSIALLFAMSRVNPPPFLVLDETDAALDEANSKRYGDMIENLSKYSQLILITHNRETMARAHVIYGVTMGSDGMSKLLSVKFDEAVKVAK